MLQCPKCKTDIIVEKFSANMVEVRCSCQKPSYFMSTENDDEARIKYINKILGVNKPGSEKTVEPLGIRGKFKDSLNKYKLEERDISKYFPTKYKPRDIQIELWNEIQSVLKSGYKKIILSAPTGVGKSLLAASIANQIGSSFIVTSTKSLQDQYSKDLTEFYSVKGKGNFACYKIMEQKKIPLDDIEQALKKSFTCNYGICTETVFENGIEKKQPCKFKPTIDDLDKSNFGEHDCLYYTQKYFGLISAHSVWNYSSYFQIIDQRKNFEEYLGRGVAIFDEAHKIEDQIIQFIGTTILRSWTDECKINVNPNSLQDIDKILGILEGLANAYAQMIKKIKDNHGNQNVENVGILEEKFNKIITGMKAISTNKSNFVINNPEIDKNGEFRSISIQPLYISKYVNDYFQNPIQIFMSATIDKASFCENMGFSQDTVAFVDTLHSPFRLENRQIFFENIAKLNYQSPDTDIKRAHARIDEILLENSNQRGLILTSSKSRCFEILNNLSEQNKKRITVWHSSDSSKRTIEQVIEDHKSKKDGVLMSSSLWEGVDLKDDLSRFQIIEKTPYADMSDKRVKIKMQGVPMWYQSQTLMKLLQGFGRSIRNEQDWAKTYVIDSGAQDLLNKLRDRVPHAYYDVFGWN